MVFKIKDALEVRDRILALDRALTRKEVENILREHTGTMFPWWLRTYMTSMVSSGMLVLQGDGTFKAIKNWKPIA
jgi:hypothetical protein